MRWKVAMRHPLLGRGALHMRSSPDPTNRVRESERGSQHMVDKPDTVDSPAATNVPELEAHLPSAVWQKRMY